MSSRAHPAEQLAQRLSDGTARSIVIGLGYVGLPFAVLHADCGLQCVGIERQARRRDAVNEGRSYIEEVADDDLRRALASGRFRATSTFEDVADADVISICVPTPLDAHKNPDVSAIHYVLGEGRDYFRAGQLVVLESTTYPGTTQEILVPFFEGLGLTPGEDIFIAFAPERIDPGNRAYGVQDIPRVVGGVTPTCGAVAAAFYRHILRGEVHLVSSPAVAEMTKMIENVFRVVNVSLMNELAQLSDRMGIDVWEAIEAASTKPFGYMPFYPGPGVGGHCIPIDPFYLAWKAREYGFETRFIEVAGEVNDRQPLYVVDQVTSILNEHGQSLRGARVLLVGLAFKKNVSDTRESAALYVARALMERGAEVIYHDPWVPSARFPDGELKSSDLTDDLLTGCDIAIVTTDHDGVDYERIARLAPVTYDTRNAVPRGLPRVYRLGAPA